MRNWKVFDKFSKYQITILLDFNVKVQVKIQVHTS
jgi:hypothetical protein